MKQGRELARITKRTSAITAHRSSLLAATVRTTAAMAGVVLVLHAHGASPFRYDDNLSTYIDGAPRYTLYDQLKYIPVGNGGEDYVSFGGDIRERVEAANVGLLGFRYSRGNSYLLHRALFYGDVQRGGFRAFVQVGDELQSGRKPSAVPTDVDRVDVAQGFLDYRFPLDSIEGADTIRAGRFEMSFDDGALIGLRDGPNVRQSWDGVRDSFQSALVQVDAFDVNPVVVTPGWFDDPSMAKQHLWGFHLQPQPQVIAPFDVNAFYYGSTMPLVAIWPTPAKESTQTYGVRLSFAENPWDGSAGVIGQRGHLGDRAVRAWSAHGDAGWTFSDALWTPRIGVRFDVLSGGNNAGDVVRTFNALYPNYAFSTEATLEAPANLIQPAVTADVRIGQNLAVQYKLEGLWRYSTQDAFYAAPFFPLVVPNAGNDDRFSGTEQQVRAVYVLNRFFTLTTALVHFSPSAFLRSGHAVGEMFEMSEISLRL